MRRRRRPVSPSELGVLESCAACTYWPIRVQFGHNITRFENLVLGSENPTQDKNNA